MSSVLLIRLEPELQAHLKPRISRFKLTTEVVRDPQHALEWISSHHSALQAVVVGAEIEEPVRLAQRIHRLDRDIPLLILSDSEHYATVSRALQFTPFLGDYVSSHLTSETSEIADSLHDALTQVQRRQQFRSTLASMNRQLQTMTMHRISAVQYLDHVLDYAPIGVVALDPSGYIISGNRSAGEILEHRERDLLGASLVDAIDADEPDKLYQYLSRTKRAGDSVSQGVLMRKRRNQQEQFVSITTAALPMEPGEPGMMVILQDVTPQVINEREREEALQLRDEFLSMAAHELKTPLTSVKGFVDLLGRRIEQGDWDQDRIRRVQRQLSRQIDRLDLLVRDLLDVSRIQQGYLDPQFEEVDLSSLAADVVQRFAEDPNGHDHPSLALDAPRPVNGYWDRDRIDQVITNLVSNALKFSPPESTVAVRVRVLDDHAELVVQDRGVGIPPELQKQLFQPFMRVQRGGDVPGTGLGLHITSSIVEQHRGSITVDSTPGEGSTFTVRLPLDPLRVPSTGRETQHSAAPQA